jgi:hypothetical protein
MPSDEQILARKHAREVAAEIAELAIGETKGMDCDALAAFYETLARLLPLPRPAPSPAVEARIEPFSDAQARCWGKSRMQFGKYEGQAIDQVPLSYLEKLAEPNDFTRHLRRYLASHRIAIEQEVAEQQ